MHKQLPPQRLGELRSGSSRLWHVVYVCLDQLGLGLLSYSFADIFQKLWTSLTILALSAEEQ